MMVRLAQARRVSGDGDDKARQRLDVEARRWIAPNSSCSWVRRLCPSLPPSLAWSAGVGLVLLSIFQCEVGGLPLFVKSSLPEHPGSLLSFMGVLSHCIILATR